MTSEIPLFNDSNYENNQLFKINNENNINNNDEKSIEKIDNILDNNDLNIKNNNLNNSIKSNNINDLNENKLISSIEWINYFKQSKINLEEINKVLLSNVESIDKENIKLKEVLCELIKDLKEKENSLDESLKIISKLKDNY